MPKPRTDRTRYPSCPAYVKNARNRVRRVLTEWELPESVVADVVYVVDELVANAVTHAHVPKGREVGVTLLLIDSAVRVEARDADRQKPEVRKPSDVAFANDLEEQPEHGRGLWLVEALSDQWGVSDEVIGKTVWADISLPQERRHVC